MHTIHTHIHTYIDPEGIARPYRYLETVTATYTHNASSYNWHIRHAFDKAKPCRAFFDSFFKAAIAHRQGTHYFSRRLDCGSPCLNKIFIIAVQDCLEKSPVSYICPAIAGLPWRWSRWSQLSSNSRCAMCQMLDPRLFCIELMHIPFLFSSC